jgi:hypothetical protein
MRYLILSFLLLTISFATNARSRNIQFDQLNAKQTVVDLKDIKVVGIVGREIAPMIMNAFAIELQISGTSACGNQFLVDETSDVIAFYQIGAIGPFIQPACLETIQYFWSPYDFSLEEGESKLISQKFGPIISYNASGRTTSYFVVSAKVRKKIGKTPTVEGVYFEYSDINVQLLK